MSSRVTAATRQPLRRLSWMVLTLPLAVCAAAVYVFAEWLFFVTKASVLTVVPWGERLAALAGTPWPFVPLLVGTQVLASALSLIVFRRGRAVACIPAAAILGVLVLVLIDNFTQVLFGFSSLNVDLRFRLVYVLLLMVLIVFSLRALATLELVPARNARFVALGLYLLATPALVSFAIRAPKQPEVGGLVQLLQPRQSLPAQMSEHVVPNILLLSSDGIEARHVSAYGYGKNTTPALHALRDETLFLENAFANSCRTYASMVSILTGKLPIHTGVIDAPMMLYGDARYEHLPGILKKHGYRTLQLTVWYYADADAANLVDAFDLANYNWEGVRLTRTEGDSDATRLFRQQAFGRLTNRLARIFAGVDSDAFAAVVRTRRAVFWQDARKVGTLLQFIDESAEPWFAHVHLLDSHEPLPGEPFDYEKSIRAADDSVARILAHLRRSGQLERTILVFSSDHGRAWSLRERVPLMIRFPMARHARKEPRNVQLVDVAPTLLAYLGIPAPSWMDGQSFLRAEGIDADRAILGVCGFDMNQINKPSATGWPTSADQLQSATVFLGSWWYEFQVSSGAMKAGEVDQHTAPVPQVSDEVARAAVTEALGAYGIALGSSSAESGEAGPAALRP